MKTKNVTFPLDETHKAVIRPDGSKWQLKRRSDQKGEKRKWKTLGSGRIEDDDPELLAMAKSANPDTDRTALKVALGMQRAARLHGGGKMSGDLMTAGAIPVAQA